MQTMRLRELCRALDISPSRVEQWLSRGYIEPKASTIRGRARDWTFQDAMRLKVLADLVDAGVDAAKVKYFVQHNVHGFNDDLAFLLISSGTMLELIPTTERGAPPSRRGDGPRVFTPGLVDAEIVKGVDLATKLSDPNRFVTIVIGLDALAKRVAEAWFEATGTNPLEG